MFLNVTDRAKSKFKEQLNERGRGVGIIIGVKKTGCSGYAYTLDFADQPHSGIVVNCDTFVIIVDSEAEPFLEGITIDYIKQGLNEKFDFINPNEKDRCGCGESFRV